MRYLGLGRVGFELLLRRAGLEGKREERSFSLALAKTLMRYHFVMLAEKKPTKWKRTSRYQSTRGRQSVKPLRRLVHPTLELG
jgi:hypothetical protein